MANTYESKFKGAEVDEGVNIARNLAGTGGIDIRTFGTGINTVKKIDGSILMTALGEKQDTLTVSSNVHINSLTADYITLGSSGSISLYPQSGASGNAYLPKYGGYLATTGDIPAVVPITGTGTTTVMSQKAVTDELGKKQDKITDQTSLNVGTLTLNSTTGISYDPRYTAGTLILNKNQEAITLKASAARIVFRGREKNIDRSIIQTVTFDKGTFYTHDILDPATAKNIKQFLPSSDGTFIVSSGTLAPGKLISAGPNPYTVVDSGIKTADIMTTGNVKTINGEIIIGSGDISITAGITGVNIYSGGKRGTITNITFDSDIYNTPTISGPTGGAQDWLIMPTPKTKTINGQSILGSGDITIGGGSAGVSSIGGKTGAITLSTGLAMSGQQLVNKVKVYTSGNYLCIDTN